MVHFGKPLLPYVLKGGGRGDGEADEEDVGLGVREGAKTVVVFLSGCVEETEGVGFVADPGRLVSRACTGWRGGMFAYITVTA